MKTLIIFDHPYTAAAGNNVPHHRSFLAALLQATLTKLEQAGDTIDLIDLHADNFDPVMSATDLTTWRKGQPLNAQVADYQQRLLAADRIIFMFPVWWEVMPAMTKGFLDKVYAKGQCYDPKSMQTKLVKQPRIEIITTMSTPNWAYRLLFGAPLAKMLFRGTFIKTRLWHFKWHNFAQVEKKTLAQRQAILRDFTI
ncbi:NAD(P)H-dependent oxidoreductase [Lactiplantibacillus sp. WILCCON 0030]|uniref:NAD(P)H-dependent oxidoreductase n=1 Tax=Lactiplantibacillus brownii TaxID=3069269 RepID=A0ABU1A6V0_9LACO|nr:NAD(P)H-dependent oxidoreductase [Lactiplantibacillus brownii]MDQ7936679.1 NAD(P)H-dependent oxidoreductase [Lactiplantibacillus brownii]